MEEAAERLEELKDRARRRLLDDPSLFEASDAQRRLHLREVLRQLLEDDGVLVPAVRLAALVREISDEVLGLGRVEMLLRDPTVTEVLINSPEDIYVEQAGRLQRAEIQLDSQAQILHLVERVIGPLGLRLDESRPFVEARLPDGSRLHAIIPPLAVHGPVVTIRRFATHPFTLASLVANGTLSEEMASFLHRAVRMGLNIVVSGGTGSGKTTLLNVLSGSIPTQERVITIEETAELRLARSHVVSLEARPPNIEGKGEVTVRDLLRNALRMRPDRIVVGEVRGAEALDMLQALNTGHRGSLTTCHANSPKHLLARLETLVMMAGMGMSTEPLRQQIAAALHLAVHVARLSDGSRKVVKITEVSGLGEDGLALVDLFRFREIGRSAQGGIEGAFECLGPPPVLGMQE
ncbi:MAG: CpaF family protein [Actinomycetota bacterium]